MKAVYAKRPISVQGNLIKKMMIKTSNGAVYRLHTPYMDPDSKAYFMKTMTQS